MSPSDSESLIEDPVESDSDFSVSSYSSGTPRRAPRPPSPEPIWLQAKEVPKLILPESSDDLLVPQNLALKATSIYEVLRRFRNLVRLSPFRLEDFCAALMCDDQSTLLTEVHIMLLKAALREEDSQATHFGPLDQKDSVNISLYVMDNITWPEVFKIFVESDLVFDRSVLNILSTKEYPFTDVEDRLSVLQFLADLFLITTPVRDDLLQEGPIHYDDHCRICHRLGDLLCCETCPAVFHLECVDPPLVDVPTEDWQCNICKLHKVSGVVDCVSTLEKQGMLCRQDHLGFDRHGRKYWFIGRRIFIETEDGTEIWYYSTVAQFELLLSKFDSDEMESALYRELMDYKDEIVRQMQLTENLTDENKGSKKSYFEIENQIIEKSKEVEEVPENHQENDEEIVTASINKKDDSDMEIDVECSTGNNNKIDETPVQKNMVTRLTTGSITPRTYDNKRKNSSTSGSDSDLQITKNKTLFKLGMENSYKTYVNQYSINTIALNKPQRNEERDKKRHLSHKFSLTLASEFKWLGTFNGTQTNIIGALRQTYISLEQSISPPYMHSNWPLLKKTWLQAVTNSVTARDFAKTLIVLQTCIKGVIFANVWHEQLGHVKLHRITSTEREEKKKLEKREKRERDDEEERNRLAFNFVKYSLGLKHQVWKQKGEEYRIHGQWDWVWLSYGRRQIKKSAAVLKIEPEKILLKIKNDEKEFVVTVEPKTYEFLKKCQIKEEEEITIPENFQNIEISSVISKFDEIDVSRSLNQSNRLFYPKIAKKSLLDDLLSRRILLKENEEKKHAVDKKPIDDLIDIENDETAPPAHIVHIRPTYSCVEKELLRIVANKPKPTTTTQQPNQTNLEQVNEIAKKIQIVRVQYAQLNRLGKNYKCYAKECAPNSNVLNLNAASVVSCYSPLCLQKAGVRKELLLLLRKAHSIGSKEVVAAALSNAQKKPSILEQKLTEVKNFDQVKKEQPNPMNTATDPKEIAILIENDFKKAILNSNQWDEESLMSCITEQSEKFNKIEVKENDVKIDIPEVPKVDEEVIKIDFDEVREEIVETEKDDEIQLDEPKIDEPSEKKIKLDDESQEDDDEEEEEIPEPPKVEETRRTLRMSTRGRPPKVNKTITTTTTTKTISKYVDGTMDSFESSSHYNLKIKDNTFGKFASIERNQTSNYNYRPNRRFALIKAIKKDEPVKLDKEYAQDGTEKIYSASKSQGKIYLKKIKNEPVKKTTASNQSKYPVLANFDTKKQSKSIMVLPRHELIKLARFGGKMSVPGYHHLAKNNTQVWPYPCSRPLFKTAWLFRTINVKTLSAVAHQLRIMWACLKWDDMATKPPNIDGKHQVTTETEIMSLELLKHRYVGKFMEKTQYLRRKVVIPLELPKTIRGIIFSYFFFVLFLIFFFSFLQNFKQK